MQLSPPPLFKKGTPAAVKLAGCIVLSVLLMILDIRYKALEGVRSVSTTLIAPLEWTMTLPRSMFRSTYDYFTTKGALEIRNEQLEKQVGELTLLANQYEQAMSENAHLRKLIGIQEQTRFKILISQILFNPPNSLSQRVVIDRGEVDQIKPGQAVADDQGILGQVVRVMENRSEVALLDDRDMSIPIQVSRNGLRGVLYGAGRGKYLELRHISANSDIQVGDVLMTSGIDGIYPPGFQVAVVDKIERVTEKNFANIYCLPQGGLNRYRHVMVLFYDSHFGPKPNYDRTPKAETKSNRLYRGKP